jgi:quinol monooxygenase YgiN
MAGKQIIKIVGTQCQPADDEKFNKWYNEVHIPMVMKSKKVQGVIRYKATGSTSRQPQYVAIYKFANIKDAEEHDKSPELAAARNEMNTTWGKKAEVTSAVQYELIKEW